MQEMTPIDPASWTINVSTMLGWIFGPLVAGLGLIWAFGRKWQTVEQITKELKEIKDKSELAVVKLESEIAMMREGSSVWREHATAAFATRDDVNAISRRVDNLLSRLSHGPAE